MVMVRLAEQAKRQWIAGTAFGPTGYDGEAHTAQAA
jgi:hypothetical protein